MAHKRFFRWPSLGWLFLLATVLVGCVLLVINSLLVSFLLGQIMPALPGYLRNPRFVQTSLFIGPVLFLVVEWWAYDVLTDWIFPLRRSSDDALKT